MPGSGGGFSPQALRHPWRTASIFSLFFLVASFGTAAWNHSLSVRAFVIGLVGTGVIFLVVRLIAALAPNWRGGD